MNPNVELIRSRGMRIIKGCVPAEVRKELNNAIKNVFVRPFEEIL
jgi:hypothetical protein